MTVENMTRTYRMGRRAESMADTRRRLTEAIVELHESIGPGAHDDRGDRRRAAAHGLSLLSDRSR